MKYKDFKQMSMQEMKKVKGGIQPGDGGDGKYCNTEPCTITLVSGSVSGSCGTIIGSGMTLDQCGCIKSGHTSQPNSSCNPKPGA